MELSRWEGLSPEDRERYVPLCPDFVVELLARTDSLAEMREKMQAYMENGARLGWLINPRRKQVGIYRPGEPVEILENPASVSGEPVLPGFTLGLTDILS